VHAVAALAVIAMLTLPAAAAGQRIDGRVLDGTSRQPIGDAVVRLLRGDSAVASALTDSTGRFTLAPTEPGRFSLVANRLGYADARSALFDIEADAALSADLIMSVDAVSVADLEITVPRDRYLESKGFYERMATGTGDFRTGEEVRRRNAQTLVDVLRGMRGVKVQRVGWKQEVYFAGAGCLPQVIVDGVTVRYGGRTVRSGGALSVEDLVNPAHIEGIEAYRGSSGVPLEFEGPNAACGTIVVWTRLR
jgi:Carboxypeptidase regulatory-like domain/TonB-dependent Receptor Plug Domain